MFWNALSSARLHPIGFIRRTASCQQALREFWPVRRAGRKIWSIANIRLCAMIVLQSPWLMIAALSVRLTDQTQSILTTGSPNWPEKLRLRRIFRDALCIFRWLSGFSKLKKLQLLRFAGFRRFSTWGSQACEPTFVLCRTKCANSFHKSPANAERFSGRACRTVFSHHFQTKRWIVNCESARAHTSNLDYAIKQSERECRANQINRSWKELIELLEMASTRTDNLVGLINL